jgi:hypothetical protein
MTQPDQQAPIEGTPDLQTDSDKIVAEFGKTLYLGSTGLQRDFAVQMTTTCVGFFAVYFALMKFLGLEKLVGANASASPLVIAVALLPPIMLIVALVCFVAVVMPIGGNMSLDDLNSIQAARKRLIDRRRRLTILGVGVFSGALLLTTGVAILALRGT